MEHTIGNEAEQKRFRAEQLLVRLLSPQPSVIGIEGGPCGGKSTVLETIAEQADRRGKKIVILPEVATKWITSLSERGHSIEWLAQYDRPAYLEVERGILGDIQHHINGAITEHSGTDTIIITDRTTVAPYVTPEEFSDICASLGISADTPLMQIDKMIYLPSVARLQPHLYKDLQSTNTARFEDTAEAAKQTCERTLAAVATHPELHIVADRRGFDKKLSDATNFALETDEIEQKWIVDMPEAEQGRAVDLLLSSKQRTGELLSAATITQSYHTLDGVSFRLRKREVEGGVSYSFTIKSRTDNGRKETNRTISEAEYTSLYQASHCEGELQKDRVTFLHSWQVWSVDRLQDDTGVVNWFFETEVADVHDLTELEHPLPLVETDLSMRQLAAEAGSQIS
ncbi:hypothetical protein CYG49_01345 [Candidatus Saccharibacteria bacterium]|nr:MAG: hypothetical protein CYG49_01345 [Candidatus Saccharibacteria bacterium]